MSQSQDTQLEKVIEEVLKSRDVHSLDVYLQRHTDDMASITCSQQFLIKLDKLISRSLDEKDPKAASLAFSILYKYGKNLKLAGSCQGLSGLIAIGLIKKMVQWFEKCRQLWIQSGPKWNELLFNLSEDFFDALMVTHETNKDGRHKVTEFFLYPVGKMAVDPRIYILIQKEAMRKFNLLLDNIPVELKQKKILSSQEAPDIMIKIAGRILECGDYDLQTALMEALCRMATPDQRKEQADRLFSMKCVATAFVKISDSEFETDCRKFLNLVNGLQEDSRRVYSYPCLEVYLDKNELLMPADDNLEDFWIDFNLGSNSISFYFSLADEEAKESQWETICISENEVQSFTVKEEGESKILHVKLSEVVIVGLVEGSSLTVHFRSSLDILQVTRSVYGIDKDKGFLGKTGTSVVKTRVKIIMEENNSQIVPESQVSLGDSEKHIATSLLPAPPAQLVTSAKMRISESTISITGSAGRRVQYSSLSSVVMAPTNGKGKPPLEMVRSSEWGSETGPGENTRTTASDEVQADQEDHLLEKNFVPNTQLKSGKKISSNLCKLSVSEMLTMSTQKTSSQLRTAPSSLELKEERLSSAQRMSVPTNSPLSQKKQVLKEKIRDSDPQEKAVAPKRKLSNAKLDSKGKSSADECTSKQQNVQRDGPTKQKRQALVEQGDGIIKAPSEVSTGKVQHGKIPPDNKVGTSKALSRKEMGDAAATGSIAKLISSCFETKTRCSAKDTAKNIPVNWIPPNLNRLMFNSSWLSAASKKEYVAVNLTKPSCKTTDSFTMQRGDVYAFSVDEPLSIVGKNRTFNNTFVMSSGIGDSSAPQRTTNKHQIAKEKCCVKKHLFIDPDTDNAMTEVSWLRESSRKPKPKVTKYSRQPTVKSHASYESSAIHLPTHKQIKDAPNKKPPVKESAGQPKKTVKPAAVSSRPPAVGRRPRRAAATFTKGYKEADTDDSQSESEKLVATRAKGNGKSFIVQKNMGTSSAVREVKRRNGTSAKKSSNNTNISENNKQLGQKKHFGVKQHQPEMVLSETSKLKKKDVSSSEEQTRALRDSWAADQISFSLSPPFIEGMRSAERSTPTLGLTRFPLLTPRGSPLPASPDLPCRATPSSILLIPTPHSTVRSKGNFNHFSFYSTEKKHCSSKASSVQSVRSFHPLTPRGKIPAPDALIGPRESEISLSKQPLPVLPHSPLPQPLLTSTLLELDKPTTLSPPQSPFPEDNMGCTLSLSKVSSVSLSQSSTKWTVHTSRVKDGSSSALAVSHRGEKTPTFNEDQQPPQLYVSGPSCKRYTSLSSNSEEEEEEEQMKSQKRGQCSPRIKPRKLFKSYTELSVEAEVSQVMSSSCTLNSGCWETKTGDDAMDMEDDWKCPEIAVRQRNLCQQFSTELEKKFQSRLKMVELHNKHSMKTVQQHLHSIDMQMAKYRTERLALVEAVLLEEIQKLEQDETVLKTMEKDLTIYWKKQITAFHSYHEQETRRNETLAGALQSPSHMCPSLEYEEKIFTSQMGLLVRDIKSLQGRLLSQMQEGEIQSVKRGLHALFFP